MDGLLIGRFQPFHLGHLEALGFALSKVRNLWLGLGSSNRPMERDNPFSAEERKGMILSSIDADAKERITIYPISDFGDHVKWIEGIDSAVPKFDIVFSNDPLTAHLYSRRSVDVLSIPFVRRDELSGTRIRDLIVRDQEWEHLVPHGTRDFLRRCGAGARLKIL